MSWSPKFTDEIVYYAIDWSRRLADGDSITSAANVSVTRSDSSLVADNISHSGNVTRVRISAGPTGGGRVDVKFLAITASGERIGATETLVVNSR